MSQAVKGELCELAALTVPFLLNMGSLGPQPDFGEQIRKLNG